MKIQRKQVVAGAMILMVACAGYLNWSYEGTQTGEVSSEADYVPIGQTTAVFSENKADNKKEKSTLTQMKLDRDNKRSEAVELIKSTLLSANLSDEERGEAQNKILSIADALEKEQSIESLIMAKGLGESVVYITDGSVEVVWDAKSPTEAQRAQIRDVIWEFTENNNIKIVELNK